MIRTAFVSDEGLFLSRKDDLEIKEIKHFSHNRGTFRTAEQEKVAFKHTEKRCLENCEFVMGDRKREEFIGNHVRFAKCRTLPSGCPL